MSKSIYTPTGAELDAIALGVRKEIEGNDYPTLTEMSDILVRVDQREFFVDLWVHTWVKHYEPGTWSLPPSCETDIYIELVSAVMVDSEDNICRLDITTKQLNERI